MLEPPADLSGLILAGGQSRRMGRDKALIEIDGQTLVARQAALLRSIWAREVIISGRPGVSYGVEGARVVYDAWIDAGPLAGLAAGLEAAASSWTMVLAVDLPLVTVDLLRRLIAARCEGCGVVPVGRNGYEPLAALYPRSILFQIEENLRAGRLRMQDLVEAAVASGQLAAWPLSADDQQLLLNWNVPSDLGGPLQ
jgi:molybdenum cofactor guanylyltransferase